MKKELVVGICLLFIGVAIAQSIKFTAVKASYDNDVMEVTSQACGIKGYGDTTVKLTRQQYQDLEQYLADFSARLNQTTTRHEAVILFKDAMAEFDTYGLLPKGMSVDQAQSVVSGERARLMTQNFQKIIQALHHTNSNSSSYVIINLFCSFYAHTSLAFEDNLWELLAFLFSTFDLKIFDVLGSLMFDYGQVKPFRFMNRIWVAGLGIGGYTYDYFTVGLLGIRRGSDDFGTAYGFSGLKLILDDQLEAVYIGRTLLATK